MRVGILSTCQFSMFSGGIANTTIALIEIYRHLGHDTFLLNINSNVEWYDDVKLLKEQIQVININKDDISYENPFDLIIELIPYFQSEKQRRIFSKQNIFLFRKNILIPTIEHSLYPVILEKYNFEGISKIWTFNEFITDDEIQILETMTRKSVMRMPYIWSPSIIEYHNNEYKFPLWLQFQLALTQQNQGKVSPWQAHICETNTTSSSSCTIPMLIMRQAKISGIPVDNYKIHNTDQIIKSDFFKDNIKKHCEIEGLSGEFVGRQRVVDFVIDPMSIVISHVRFIPFKPILLDLAWVGIPFIHNSEFLNKLSCFERYYYPNNKISVGVEKIKIVHEDFINQKGWFNLDNIQKFRNQIIEEYTFMNESIQKEYNSVFEENIEQIENIIEESSINKIILFTDFWPDFNTSYNFFTLLLENSGGKNLKFYGENDLPKNATPDLIIFSLFGESWKKYSSIPKIHFTGENTPPILESSIILNLGFGHADMVGDNYLRFPLWITEIDWFNCDKDKICNPKPISLESCIKPKFDELKRKKKFCAFVVSNPTNDIRNLAYLWLNDYKPVDSAGRVFNNMGDSIFAGGGGGGGELKKIEFLKDYKFCICYENSSSQGYTTEKILHAKAAGCIPIYWGDPKLERDFDTNGIIDARKIYTKEDLINAVKEIDEDNTLYLKKYSIPALDNYHVDWARRTMSECANRIFKALKEAKPINVPRFIEIKLPISTTKLVNTSSEIETPLVVTYATRDFLPSLNQWLASFEAQRTIMPNIKALVYLGHDVPDGSKEKILDIFKFVEFAYLPKEVPADFPDIFEGKHYAWKIYIYNQLAQTKNTMVFYLDAGGFMCRWPSEYLRIAQENDICVLEDTEQYNMQWCSEKCKKIMAITNDELNQHQIVGGIMAFRAGSEKAKIFFAEAWKYAQMKDCVIGEKWLGIKDGKPYGHRHDQSIMSILSLRHNLAKYNLQTLYCDKSLRRTFLDKKYLYIHRGNFKIHEQFLEGIDDCFVINLKRRKDRLDRLYENSPEFKNKIYEFEAFEGCKIQLTDSIARLFKPHDFMWKKAIMGCALSHLQMWFNLVNEKPDINNYLILEDDVKFIKGWQQSWLEALPYLPENYDIIYLGGILPPNRAGFETIKEPVNKYFSRIKENNFFGQQEPTRYFHWCAYSYVISKQGAEKILSIIQAKDGYYTSADHMICNPVDFLNIYFLDPLVAGCYQDDDPVYKNSEFNNFNRIDGFDSDLWNNDERFDISEMNMNIELNIERALYEARTLHESQNVSKETLNPPKSKSRYCMLESQKLEWNTLYESAWLYEMLGKPKIIELQSINNSEPLVENPIFIVMKGHIDEYNSLFTIYNENNINFYVIHLSDEYGTDDISFYDMKSCKGVVRNYIRNDISNNKVLILPLGYHYTVNSGVESPYERTPQLPFRSNIWSFFGTNWKNRNTILDSLQSVGKHTYKLYDNWNDAQNLKQKEYCSVLLDSIFVPCIEGQNHETFRFYEALECGCIPIIIDSEYFRYISKYIPLINLPNWNIIPQVLYQLYNDKESLESYRFTILNAYKEMKITLKEKVKNTLNLV